MEREAHCLAADLLLGLGAQFNSLFKQFNRKAAVYNRETSAIHIQMRFLNI